MNDGEFSSIPPLLPRGFTHPKTFHGRPSNRTRNLYLPSGRGDGGPQWSKCNDRQFGVLLSLRGDSRRTERQDTKWGREIGTSPFRVSTDESFYKLTLRRMSRIKTELFRNRTVPTDLYNRQRRGYGWIKKFTRVHTDGSKGDSLLNVVIGRHWIFFFVLFCIFYN